MRFGLLGVLCVERDGDRVDLGSRRQRALLARLLLDPGQAISTDRLVDDLWGEHPPPKVSSSVQAYVSNLRRLLEPDRQPRATGGVLSSRDPGYAVDLAGHALDVQQFHGAAAHCRQLVAQGLLHPARQIAEQALALWRGPALADLVDEYDFARRAAERLEADRATVVEELLGVRVETGDHLAVLADLEVAVREYPFRERGWELLVRALYRSGRTVEALERCREAYALLREELGIEPGTALLELEAALLRRDPALDPPPAVAAVSFAPTHEVTAASAVQATPVVPAAHAPVPLGQLVGRERDLDTVRLLLAGTRLLTVTGPGGVGKTSLALHVAGTVSDSFPDGVVFVPLAATTDPALVLPTLARDLGVEQPGGDPFAALHAALSNRQMLIVLDNVEHVLPAAVDIARLLEVCPSVTVLATGRAPLRLRGEHEYPLPPLLAPDPEHRVTPADLLISPAARLFVERAQALLPGYQVLRAQDAEAVAEICRRLDGLPLALELAAAWLRVLTPPDLLRRLDQSLSVLAGGPRDLPERQRTVRDTVAWSFELLDSDERDQFSRLGVFRGGWTMDAAGSVTSVDGDSRPTLYIAAAHAALVERSLVTRVGASDVEGEPRFTMLETVREFAVEQLDRQPEAGAVRSRHAAYYGALAQKAEPELVGPRQGAWVGRVGSDYANLRAAMTWYLENGNPGAVAEIAWNIRWFWHIRGFQAEGRRWMARVLAAPDLDSGSRARAHLVDGQCAFGQGAWDDARAMLEAAHGCQAAAPEVVAAAASLAGHAAAGRGDWAGVTRWADIALQAHSELGDAAGGAIAALLPVQVAVASGALSEADGLLDVAEELLRTAGGSWGIAVALNIRVMIGQLQGRSGELLPRLHESIVRSAQLRDTAAFLYGLTSLAEVLVAEGDLATAARLFGAAEALTELTGLHMQPPASRMLYDQHVSVLHARLDETSLQDAWCAGRGLSLAETFELASTASR